MGKMRTFSPEFKVQVVLDLLTGACSLGEICREHQIKDSVVCRWRQEFLERAPQVFTPSGSASSAEQARIAELERVIGRLTVELEAAKKACRLRDARFGSNGR
jgi:transposase